MRLPRIPLLWQQWDGPQGNALIQAVFKWFREVVLIGRNVSLQQGVDLLDYYDHLSIATAHTDHLTMIGRLMGIPRPMLIASEYAENFFRFTHTPNGTTPPFTQSNPMWPGNPYDKGFWRDPRDPEWSHREMGTMSYADSQYPAIVNPMEIEAYRILLQTIARSKGEIGSLMLLDDICRAFVPVWHDPDEPDYQLEWWNVIYDPIQAGDFPGRVVIKILHYDLMAYTVLQSLVYGLYQGAQDFVVDMPLDPDA